LYKRAQTIYLKKVLFAVSLNNNFIILDTMPDYFHVMCLIHSHHKRIYLCFFYEVIKARD